jgi:hypothetical protein
VLLLPLSAPVIASSTSSTTDGGGSSGGNKAWRQKLAAWGSRLKRSKWRGSSSSGGGARDQGPPGPANDHLMAFTGGLGYGCCVCGPHEHGPCSMDRLLTSAGLLDSRAFPVQVESRACKSTCPVQTAA